MKVTGRITAKKADGAESHVARQSNTAIFFDASTGHSVVSVIVRADGIIDIEVKRGREVVQSLRLREDGTRSLGSIVDGQESLL